MRLEIYFDPLANIAMTSTASLEANGVNCKKKDLSYKYHEHSYIC